MGFQNARGFSLTEQETSLSRVRGGKVFKLLEIDQKVMARNKPLDPAHQAVGHIPRVEGC